MTPKEKAEKYDEALRRARKLKEDPTSVFYEYSPSEDTIADYIFPELKESEDEKISKVLVDYFKRYKELEECDIKTFFGIPTDNILAWLEKKGDKDELIKELGEYKAKYTQEVLEKHLRTMNKDDERLRKTTIAFLKDFAKQGYENAVECIDWLEKQGEQKPQGKTALEAINEEKVDNTNKIESKFRVKYAGNEYNVLDVKDIAGVTYYGIEDEPNHIDYVLPDNCEIVSEQKLDDKVEPKDYSSIDPHFGKPIDKVEPKFKQGQWIVWKDKCYEVNYNGCGYELIDQNGLSTSLEYETVDTSARLWDITKDAKDGDVLQLGKVTAIFQNYISNKECRCYCSVFDGEFKIPVQYADTYGCHNAVPATKEQRDILMKAMADAGFTFDFEKKELKKIYNEIEIPFGAKDSELTYYIPKGFHAEIDDDKVVIKKGEKLTVWSEEDEEIVKDIIEAIDTPYTFDYYNEMVNWLKSLKCRVGCEANCTATKEWIVEDMSKIQRICKYLDEAKKYYADITEVRECMDWLKSLKEREQPHPKQEWSKEDDRMLNVIIADLIGFSHSNTSTLESHFNGCIDWLKSIKDRYI